MDLSRQVCSLEQAKKLKGLGIEQKGTQFYWTDIWNCGYQLKHVHIVDDSFDYAAAFTVAELGVMLPTTLSFNGTQKASIDYGWMNAFYIAYRRHSSLKYCTKIIENVREASARADMLIHLLESGHTSPAEVNARLQ